MLAVCRNGHVIQNSILQSLLPADFEHLRPSLELVTLKERSVLQEPNREVEYAYFVETGLISLMTLASGDILETAMVGSQGFDPACIALGARSSAHRSMVSVSGSAFRIDVEDLRRAIRERPQIREHLLPHIHSLLVQVSQTGFCALQHHLDQRLACWLCFVCDATEDSVIPITQDHLATTLGFKRIAVTLALKRFENEGLVRKTRGILQICDRESLQRKACCCYGALSGGSKRKTKSTTVNLEPKLQLR